MRVTVLGTPTDIPVTTVTLTRNAIDPMAISLMHCISCGEKVLQHQGNLVSIYPGGLPQNIFEVGIGIIARCKNCKHKYLIHSIV